jgi:hypothetical protein
MAGLIAIEAGVVASTSSTALRAVTLHVAHLIAVVALHDTLIGARTVSSILWVFGGSEAYHSVFRWPG